ncbi:hypothetical protein [Nonomuraea jabiensis]|uniref:hypothetical protein n=1 Tax=Nonomuraea jabiensis TaxID=882448 RepID=UPI0036CC06A0
MEELHSWIRQRQFADPSGIHDDRPYWSEKRVLTWLARWDPSSGARIPITFWPPASQPAEYLEAEEIDQVGVAVRWRTAHGVLYLFWHHRGWGHHTLDRAQRRLQDHAAAIVKVDPDFSHHGPSLSAICPSAPGTYYPSWPQLAQVIGGPIPFWPAGARTDELIKRWRPEMGTAVTLAVAEPDPVPLLRMAAVVEPGFIRDTLINMAQVIQHQATEAARDNLRHVQRTADPSTYVIAAEPMDTPAAGRDDIPEDMRRATWLEVLRRTDILAQDCLRVARLWNGGKDLPASRALTFNADTPQAREWNTRLTRCPRNALIDSLDPHHEATETLVDPLTDTFVVRKGETLTAAVPVRLAASAPLAELILADPIWVRTADGVLYPAPQHPVSEIGWGYPGSGPSALAWLINHLLNDITAAPASPSETPPAGLISLVTNAWPPGTVLTRKQLQQACDTG